MVECNFRSGHHVHSVLMVGLRSPSSPLTGLLSDCALTIGSLAMDTKKMVSVIALPHA